MPPETDLLEQFLASRRTPATRAAYRSDLVDFAKRYPDTTPEVAMCQFAGLPPDELQRITAEYKAELLQRGVMPATINRRLAAIRALLAFASGHGSGGPYGCALIANHRAARAPAAGGLTATQVRCLLALPDMTTLRGKRDAALLRLFFENALRPQEICSVRADRFSRLDRSLLLPNGISCRTIGLSLRCATVIGDYLAASGHGNAPVAPLLLNLDHRPEYRRSGLTTKGIRHILKGYGQQIGTALSPRVLRHTAAALAAATTSIDAGSLLSVLDGEASHWLPAGDGRHGRSQRDITTILSDLASDPSLIRADARRLSERSRALRDQSNAVAQRSDWLQRKSQELQKRLEEQAVRWSRFGRWARDEEADGR